MRYFLKNRGLDKLEKGLEKNFDLLNFFSGSQQTKKSYGSRSHSVEVVKNQIEAETKSLEPYENGSEISYFLRKSGKNSVWSALTGQFK